MFSDFVICRYHMFLSFLAEESRELGLQNASNNYQAASSAIQETQKHTNILMWVGETANMPGTAGFLILLGLF